MPPLMNPVSPKRTNTKWCDTKKNGGREGRKVLRGNFAKALGKESSLSEA